MSAEVRRELNALLVAQLDRFDELIHQRNIARDTAVALQQHNGHLTDCAEAAWSVVLDMQMACSCTYVTLGDGPEPELEQCNWCRLRGFLADMLDGLSL